jgi:AraC-like DNA-binding protein
MGSFAFEKHYRVKELAGLWGLSPKTVSRIFAEEAGVIRITNDGTTKRKYATLSIPESVASRVHQKLGNQPFSDSSQATQEVRIIRLGNIDSARPDKGRTVIRLKRQSN